MTLRKSSPIDTALVEPMLSKGIRQFSAGNHDIKNVLKRFDVKFGVPARNSIVALKRGRIISSRANG
jgi:hypothetical protein